MKLTEAEYQKFKKDHHIFKDPEWAYVFNVDISDIREARIRMAAEERARIISADYLAER